jgi:hypothetical protein
MKAAVGREKYLTFGLTLATLLLAGVLLWEWDRGLSLERDLLKMRDIPVTPVKSPNILPEIILPAADVGFPELISRSLFSIARRSLVAANKGGVVAMKKGQFVLVGVLVTPQQKSALLRDVQTNKTETVASAAVVRGMTLGVVESSRVVLHQGADSEELLLNVQTGTKVAVVPRQPAPLAPPAAVATPPALPASVASAPVRVASGTGPPLSAPIVPAKPAITASAPQAQPSSPSAQTSVAPKK